MAHRYANATVSPSVALSLESFPSLSSLSWGDGNDDGDCAPSPVRQMSRSRRSRSLHKEQHSRSLQASWKRSELLASSSSSSDEQQEHSGSESDVDEQERRYEDPEEDLRSSRKSRRQRDTSICFDSEQGDDTDDDGDAESPLGSRTYIPPPRIHIKADTTTNRTDEEADDDEPEELSHRCRPRSPAKQKPAVRSRSPRQPGNARGTSRPISQIVPAATITNTTTTSTAPTASQSQPPLRQQHFVACFVRVDPPLLRALTHLELSSVQLTRTDLRILCSNLFLLQTLRSISLYDNQLDDSCIKEIRTILSLEGLVQVNLGRNLLGRGTARMIADRLKHRLALQSLDVAGNARFFAFDDATDVARELAQGLACNPWIVELSFRFKVLLPHLARDRFILPPPPPVLPSSVPPPRQQQQMRSKPTQPVARNSLSVRDQTASPAEAFTRELALAFSQQATQSRSLQRLGLVHGELSRISIVNLMKMANRLLVLDLSFAFVGIPAAQVVTTALKMKSYATLTELNLRGNRLKTMGARAILRALHANEQLTSLNLSRNDLRSDLVPDLSSMLTVNRTLVRLDLSQNEELFNDEVTKESSSAWKAFAKAVHSQGALRCFGDLNRIHTSTARRQAMQRQLDQNHEHSDDLVLLAVGQSMAFEHQQPTQGGKPQGPIRTVTLNIQESSQRALSRVLWTQRTAITSQARVSVKWKLQALVSPARATSAKGKAVDTRNDSASKVVAVEWRVVVHRKCDQKGTVDMEAARGQVRVPTGFVLCSALVYCDAGDSLSISVCRGDGDAQDDGNDDDASESIKVLGKDFVVLPHALTLRHVLYHNNRDANDAGASQPWQLKPVSDPASDPFTHTRELQHCYIPHTMMYRLVWRVQLTTTPPESSASAVEKQQLHWQILRSHCWDPDHTAVIQEGSTQAFRAVIRNERDVIFSSEALELVAGEVVSVRVATCSPEVGLHLIQFVVLEEASAWGRRGDVTQRLE